MLWTGPRGSIPRGHWFSLGPAFTLDHMPLPTDRYRRFVWRQRRYRRRYQRWRRNRVRVMYSSGVPYLLRRASDWTLVGDGTRQRPHGIKSNQNGPLLLPLPIIGTHVHVTPAEQGVPPVAAVHWNVVHTPVYGPIHPNAS
jgi:hypothetical protein